MTRSVLCVVLMTLAACGSPPELETGFPEDVPAPVVTGGPGPAAGASCSAGESGTGPGVECVEATLDCGEDPCVHGHCVVAHAGRGRCACDDGYMGELCNRCASGFVAQGLFCVAQGGGAP